MNEYFVRELARDIFARCMSRPCDPKLSHSALAVASIDAAKLFVRLLDSECPLSRCEAPYPSPPPSPIEELFAKIGPLLVKRFEQQIAAASSPPTPDEPADDVNNGPHASTL